MLNFKTVQLEGVNSVFAHFKPYIKISLFLLLVAHSTALPLWLEDYPLLAVSDLLFTIFPFPAFVSFTDEFQIVCFDQIVL
jgi:hypothetical protein